MLILALTSCDGWRKRDTALELAFFGTTAIDWRQTTTITTDCAESNPMIGRCGDTVPPNIYFPLALVAHAVVAACLPPTWRTVFQSFTIGLEAGTIFSNDRDGYEML
jgi:hypothetical protein